MARRRARSPKGEFIGDNPETKDVNEAWVSEDYQVPPASPEDNGKEPAKIDLNYGSDMNRTPEPVSKEKIEISVKEKLARKTDAVDSNPFVPNVQLDHEVKEIAQDKGFFLSRGTEIGARLLARARRTGK